MKRSLAISETAIDRDPASVGRALNNLAWLYQQQGRYSEAEPLVARSITLIDKALGQKDEDFGRALDTLAKVYEGEGRLSEAEALYRRAIAIIEAARGANYAGVAVSWENLGGLLKAQGKLDEAETLLKKALMVKESNFGRDHALVANSLSQLGDLYRQQGKLKDAERVFRRALAIRKATIREIQVYFATDRKQNTEARTVGFSNDSSDVTLTYGIARVVLAKPDALPTRARLGVAPSPTNDVGGTLNLETTEVTRLAIRDIAVVPDAHQVIEKARKQLRDANVFKREAFVFVHGFNVSFENAVRRTAQIAYDLNFDGTPFLFSWPGGGGLLSYLYVNADSAKIAADHLMAFLEKVVAETKATKVHLIAHSMGNGVLLDALDKLKLKSGSSSKLNFAEIVLNSPDVASGRFRQVMAAISGLGNATTLYASATDRALGLSGWISGKKAGATPSVFPGVETIDVTAAGSSFLGLNHDIYATSPAIFNDMRLVLELGTHPPHKRSIALKPVTTSEGTYWVYDKQSAINNVADEPAVAPSMGSTTPTSATASSSPTLELVSPQVSPVTPPVTTSALPEPSTATASRSDAPKARPAKRKKKPDIDPDWNVRPLN